MVNGTLAGYLVTGTDTGVGKTLVSAALLHMLANRHLRVAAYKPVAAGVDAEGKQEDVALLAQMARPAQQEAQTACYILQAACAPHIAAQDEMLSLDLPPILQQAQNLAADAQALVVEGAGGFCVPLSISPRVDTADMFTLLHQHLKLPVLLVVGMRLGCINHAVLTAQAIRARGLPLAAWVANSLTADMPYFEDNVHTLRALLDAPCLGVIPYLPARDGHARVRDAADCLALPR